MVEEQQEGVTACFSKAPHPCPSDDATASLLLFFSSFFLFYLLSSVLRSFVPLVFFLFSPSFSIVIFIMLIIIISLPC